MIGLIRKDLYSILKYCRTLLLMSALFLAMSVFSEQNFFFVIYPVIFAGVLPVTLISYEERDGWNRACDSLPLSRRTVVNERYLMALLCFLTLYLVTMAVQAAVMLPKGRGRELLELAALLPAFGLLSPAVMLPISLRWGVEKGRLAYYVMIGGLVAVGVYAANSTADLSAEINPAAIGAILGAALLLFALSWLISIRLYEKREL